jgi:hypothetical protein
MTQDKILKLIEEHGLTLHGDIEHFAALIEKHLRFDGKIYFLSGINRVLTMVCVQG